MIDAAVHEVGRKGNRFQHFIYSSVLNTQLRKLLNHDCKRYVEEYLYESGLNWTVLQPTNFMNKKMMLALYEQPREKTVFNAPWNPDKLFSMLALNDLAEVTETIVKEGEKHYMAQYPLVSTEKHTSYREAVGIFGKVMGREIEVKKMEYGEAVEGFLEMLFGGGEVDKKTRDVAQRMLLYYDNCKFAFALGVACLLGLAWLGLGGLGGLAWVAVFWECVELMLCCRCSTREPKHHDMVTR